MDNCSPCIMDKRIERVEADQKTVADRLFDVSMALEKMVGEMRLMSSRIDNHSKDLKQAIRRSEDHIDEGEREGGWRDRLKSAENRITIVENDISTLKKVNWKQIVIVGVVVGVVSGIVGGLIGANIPNAIVGIARATGVIQ